MKFSDITDLAKSGWSLKDVKEALELAESSPAVQETDVADLKKDVEETATVPEVEAKAEKPKIPEQTDTDGSILDKLFE